MARSSTKMSSALSTSFALCLTSVGLAQEGFSLFTTAGERVVNRAGNRKDLAPLSDRVLRRNQRTASQSRLNDENAERQAADDSIASREVALDRGRSNGKFAHQRAFLRNRFCERTV